MPESDQLTVPEIARIVKGNRLLIVFFSAVIFLGVVIGNIVTPNSFIAQTTIFSLKGQALDTGFIDLKAIPSEAEKDYLPLVPILTSHKITENIAKHIEVGHTIYSQAGEYIYNKTRIFSRGNLIYILVDWKEPVMAATLANAYLDSLASLLNQAGVQSKYFIVDRAVYPGNNVMLKQINLVLGLMMSVFLAVFGTVLHQYWQRVKNG
jgi:capsular polysaccharide biosynthesis protein